jgi:hypothetical protein
MPMPDFSETAQPFDAGTFHDRCPACGACNRVDVTEQYGHNGPQNYHCAKCQHVLGTIHSSVPPVTSVVSVSLCERQGVKNEP